MTERITIQECPMCGDPKFTMLPDELADADGYAECDLCAYARYPIIPAGEQPTPATQEHLNELAESKYDPPTAKNPYAERWTTFAQGEDPLEAQAIRAEAAEAEAAEVIKCGNCGDAAFYRPGVGAYQCGYCRSLLISKVVDGKVVEEWVK